MNKLYPVKHINKREFSGKLLIDGALQDNCILFRFLFDKTEMVHPLIIRVEVSPITCKKIRKPDIWTRTLECNIHDISNPMMKTRLLFPDFQLSKHKIKIINIESQVSVDFLPDPIYDKGKRRHHG